MLRDKWRRIKHFGLSEQKSIPVGAVPNQKRLGALCGQELGERHLENAQKQRKATT